MVVTIERSTASDTQEGISTVRPCLAIYCTCISSDEGMRVCDTYSIYCLEEIRKVGVTHVSRVSLRTNIGSNHASFPINSESCGKYMHRVSGLD